MMEDEPRGLLIRWTRHPRNGEVYINVPDLFTYLDSWGLSEHVERITDSLPELNTRVEPEDVIQLHLW